MVAAPFARLEITEQDVAADGDVVGNATDQRYLWFGIRKEAIAIRVDSDRGTIVAVEATIADLHAAGTVSRRDVKSIENRIEINGILQAIAVTLAKAKNEIVAIKRTFDEDRRVSTGKKDPIKTGAAGHEITAIAVDPVVAVLTTQHIQAIVDEEIIDRRIEWRKTGQATIDFERREQNVIALFANQLVLAIAADECVVVGATGERVVAQAAIDVIGTGLAEHDVGAFIAIDPVEPIAADDPVITGATRRIDGAADVFARDKAGRHRSHIDGVMAIATG